MENYCNDNCCLDNFRASFHRAIKEEELGRYHSVDPCGAGAEYPPLSLWTSDARHDVGTPRKGATGKEAAS
jgi:hypothetical protein